VDLEVKTIRDSLELAAKNNTLESAILKLNGDKQLLLDNENRIVRSSIKEGSKLAGALAELTVKHGNEQDALNALTGSFLEGSDIINHANRIIGKAFGSLNTDLETFRFGSIEEKITRLSQASQAKQISAAVAAGDISGIGVGQKGGLDFLKQFLGTGLKIGGQTAEQTLYGEGGLLAQDLQKIFPEATDDEIKKAVAGMAEAANIDQAILEASKEQVDILKVIQKGLGIETEQQTMQREIQEFQAKDRAVARQQVAREGFNALPDDLRSELLQEFKSGDFNLERAGRDTARSRAAGTGVTGRINGDPVMNTIDNEQFVRIGEQLDSFVVALDKAGLTVKEAAELIPSDININMQGQPTNSPVRDIQNNVVNQYSNPFPDRTYPDAPKIAPESF
jgi:hypothetical protein